MYNVEFSKSAKKELKKKSAIPYFEKIKKLIEELEIHPKTGIGKPEQLKYELTGCWSREISQKDRMVYTIDEDKGIVTIHQLLGHYFDK